MEFSLYDPFLDPVLLISEEGAIQYINPAGRAWLTIEKISVAGKPLDEFVFFGDTEMFENAGKLEAWQSTPPEKATFRFAANQYEGSATVSIQKIPYADDHVYAIIVRDLTFASTISVGMWNQAKTDRLDQTITATASIAADTALINQTKLVDEITLTKSVGKEPVARHQTRMNIFVVKHKLALLGHTILLSANWVEAEVKANNLAVGLSCNLEILGTPELKFVTARGKIIDIQPSEHDSVRVRFQFENLGVLTKRAIDDFLVKYSTTL